MQLVDTERYPIDPIDSPSARSLVAGLAEAFADDGVLALPRFLLPDAVAAIAAEIDPLVPQAFFCRNTHNAYLDDGGGLPPDDPRNRLEHTDVGSIANDILPPRSRLQELYDWPPLTQFIGAVLGYDQFHRGADPLGALSVNVYDDGDGHGWHFDESRFSVTVMIQEPEEGGCFEFVTGLRSQEELDSRAAVAAVLDGDRRQVQQLPFGPGTLLIFGGRETLHRVTQVRGTSCRLVPVLTYDTKPGTVNSEAVRTLFWGRAS